MNSESLRKSRWWLDVPFVHNSWALHAHWVILIVTLEPRGWREHTWKLVLIALVMDWLWHLLVISTVSYSPHAQSSIWVRRLLVNMPRISIVEHRLVWINILRRVNTRQVNIFVCFLYSWQLKWSVLAVCTLVEIYWNLMASLMACKLIWAQRLPWSSKLIYLCIKVEAGIKLLKIFILKALWVREILVQLNWKSILKAHALVVQEIKLFLVFLQRWVLACLWLVSEKRAEREACMVKGLRMVHFIVDVTHLQLGGVLLVVWLKVLGLLPLVVLLIIVGARGSWNIEEELFGPVAPNIMPIANDRASLDWVVCHRRISPNMSWISAYSIIMVPWGINGLKSRLNGRISLTHSKASLKIRFLSLLLWWEECNHLHFVLLRFPLYLFG